MTLALPRQALKDAESLQRGGDVRVEGSLHQALGGLQQLTGPWRPVAAEVALRPPPESKTAGLSWLQGRRWHVEPQLLQTERGLCLRLGLVDMELWSDLPQGMAVDGAEPGARERAVLAERARLPRWKVVRELQEGGVVLGCVDGRDMGPGAPLPMGAQWGGGLAALPSSGASVLLQLWDVATNQWCDQEGAWEAHWLPWGVQQERPQQASSDGEPLWGQPLALWWQEGWRLGRAERAALDLCVPRGAETAAALVGLEASRSAVCRAGRGAVSLTWTDVNGRAGGENPMRLAHTLRSWVVLSTQATPAVPQAAEEALRGEAAPALWVWAANLGLSLAHRSKEEMERDDGRVLLLPTTYWDAVTQWDRMQHLLAALKEAGARWRPLCAGDSITLRMEVSGPLQLEAAGDLPALQVAGGEPSWDRVVEELREGGVIVLVGVGRHAVDASWELRFVMSRHLAPLRARHNQDAATGARLGMVLSPNPWLRSSPFRLDARGLHHLTPLLSLDNIYASMHRGDAGEARLQLTRTPAKGATRMTMNKKPLNNNEMAGNMSVRRQQGDPDRVELLPAEDAGSELLHVLLNCWGSLPLTVCPLTEGGVVVRPWVARLDAPDLLQAVQPNHLWCSAPGMALLSASVPPTLAVVGAGDEMVVGVEVPQGMADDSMHTCKHLGNCSVPRTGPQTFPCATLLDERAREGAADAANAAVSEALEESRFAMLQLVQDTLADYLLNEAPGVLALPEAALAGAQRRLDELHWMAPLDLSPQADRASVWAALAEAFRDHLLHAAWEKQPATWPRCLERSASLAGLAAALFFVSPDECPSEAWEALVEPPCLGAPQPPTPHWTLEDEALQEQRQAKAATFLHAFPTPGRAIVEKGTIALSTHAQAARRAAVRDAALLPVATRRLPEGDLEPLEEGGNAMCPVALNATGGCGGAHELKELAQAAGLLGPGDLCPLVIHPDPDWVRVHVVSAASSLPEEAALAGITESLRMMRGLTAALSHVLTSERNRPSAATV